MFSRLVYCWYFRDVENVLPLHVEKNTVEISGENGFHTIIYFEDEVRLHVFRILYRVRRPPKW